MMVPGFGPDRADIVIVGEAPGADEELEGQPFVGMSGKLLTTLLREAGIPRSACYITNVCKYRPPGNDISKWLTDKKKEGIRNEWPCIDGYYASEQVQDGLATLFEEIASRQPKLVVGLGGTALWALTGESGITAWRGSEMILHRPGLEGVAFVPTLHPAAILRSWPLRAQVAHDLAIRVARRIKVPAVEPAWDFNIAPTFAEVMTFLDAMPDEVAVDVETSRGQIVCVGLGVSAVRAMCIPFISEGYGAYWPVWQADAVKIAIVAALRCRRIIGQNFGYDASYFEENFGTTLRVAHDTKIAQNVLFPGTPANLGYLSSMYCDWHRYWKDDARDWQNLRDFDRLFRYNCRDDCATFEIAQAQKRRLAATRLDTQFAERITYAHSVFDMQQRGVIRDDTETARLEAEIEEALQVRALVIATAAGRAVNVASPVQVGKVLYEDMGCKKPLRMAGGTGDEALQQVAKWHPEAATFCTAVLEWRSLSSIRSNLLRAKLDPDGFLRSSLLATGTETFRLTSSKNNFGRGTNLLNISGSGTSHSGNKIPNFRKVIVPDNGRTIFDCDLARADLQVVVWEADDADLKQKLREGLDIHYENAKDLFRTSAPTDEQREKGKTFVHLTDYGGGARTCAIQCGTTVHEADMAQRAWFAAHPGIKKWHERTKAALAMNRTVTNKFGYRMVFLDRVDDAMLRAALAWVPQSTIAILTSLIHMKAEALCGMDGLRMLLQMYDSIMGVYPTCYEDVILPKLFEATRIAIPYDDPLVIDMGIKTSTVSWGDCKKRDWCASKRAA